MEPFGTLTPGAIFARDFRVIRPLSAGGMGAVYVAEQLSTGKQRALKLMRPELVALPELRKRFEQEARLGSLIDSDHVVEVIGAGVDEASGMPWLAMELLSGRDLEAYAVQTGPCHPGTVALIFEQLCHALGAAHAKGVVHRDLKLENIFLATPRRADVPFTVKILDFGIAKVLAEAKTRITAAIGTPLWMSPEQSTAGAPITPASDVWPLGLIAFRLLTGKVYWKAANVAGASTIMLMRELLMDELSPASHRTAELGGAPLPSGFDAWFAHCVERDPARRFADARVAFESLRPLLERAQHDRARAPGRAETAGPSGVQSGPVGSPTHSAPAALTPPALDPSLAIGAVGSGARTTFGAQSDVAASPRSRSKLAYVVAGVVALAALSTLVVVLASGSSSKRPSAKAKTTNQPATDGTSSTSLATHEAGPSAALVSIHVGSSTPEIARDPRFRDGKWILPKLEERARGVSNCYREALGRSAQLSGEMKIEIDIDDRGAITAYQPEPFIGKDGELAKCVELAFEHFAVAGVRGNSVYVVTAWSLSRSASPPARPTYELEAAGVPVEP